MASTKLTRSFSTAGNRKTYTISFWVKLCDTSTNATIINVGPYGGDQEYRFNFRTDRRFDFYDYGSGAYKFRYQTNRRFRDVNAWYHFVIAVDTTQSTNSDRVKVYVNGTLESNYYIATHPSQNLDTNWNIANNWTIGATESGNYTNGCLSHFHFIDGTAYDASAFGETDANGVWKIKTSPSVTYGTNGFFILKDGNSVTDQSGNSNNWTVGAGTLTNTEDNPSNVFATWNPLGSVRIVSGTATLPTFSEGNLKATHGSASHYTGSKSTIGFNSGKWYCEVKCTTVGSESQIGLDDDIGSFDGTFNETYIYRNNGAFGNTGSMGLSTFTSGDIIQIAFDGDNGTLWVGKNGTWQNSATQSEIEAGTTTNAVATSITMDKFYQIATKGFNGSVIEANFGNGYFGTTAVSSAGTNASGNGIFEYDVPTGYTALSTKGLNL